MSATITTTLGVVAQAAPALAAICAVKLSAKHAYHVKKLAQLIAPDAQHFNDARNAAITELGELVHGAPLIKPDSPNWAAFLVKLEDLAAVPVEIPWGPVTLAMLGDEKVAAADLLALGPLFADAEPEAGA